MKYPLVSCRKHRVIAPGYAVCIHVQAGALVTFVEPASATMLGTIHCRHCGSHTLADEIEIICAACARERCWLTARGYDA